MERAICDEAKVAEHSRYLCLGCRKRIKKGLPVVRKGETTKYGFQSRSYCHRCAERQIKGSKDDVKEMAETIENTEKKFAEVKANCTKALVLEVLEYQEEEKNREIVRKRLDEEWAKRNEEWTKKQEEEEKEMEEFRKYKEEKAS